MQSSGYSSEPIPLKKFSKRHHRWRGYSQKQIIETQTNSLCHTLWKQKTGIPTRATEHRQTNFFHYDHIFQWYKFALGTCTQCGPMLSNTVELKSSLQFYNPSSKQFISFSKQLNYFKFLLHFGKQNSQT